MHVEEENRAIWDSSLLSCPYVSYGAVKACGNPDGL